MAAPSLEISMQHHVTLRNPITHYSTKSFGIKFGWNFKRFPNHWNKVWFRARLLLLNKHFARKNYVLIFYLVWISLNMSISVVVLHADAWNKCITMSPRWGNHAKPPPKFILRKFKCITNSTPARRVTPPRNVYMAKFDPGWEGYLVWQSGLPALAGHSTYYVNVIKLKWTLAKLCDTLISQVYFTCRDTNKREWVVCLKILNQFENFTPVWKI